jgi:hypothetical protein
MNEMFEDSLNALHKNSGFHVDLLLTDACVQEYYEQRQALFKAKSQAVQNAIALIEQKYQVDLWQLEQEYAVYVSMIIPQKDA